MIELQTKLAQSLKLSESEQQSQNFESELKQLIRAFCSNTDEQDHAQLRITLTCINLLALLLFHKGRQLFQKLDAGLLRKFVVRVSTLDVEGVLQANPRIESSVVYLLTLLKLVPDATAAANLKKYKNNVLQFLKHCGTSDKISFNILKLIFDLQKKDLFEDKELQRAKVAQAVCERVRGRSVEMQVLGYNILLKMGKVEAAVRLFEEALTTSDRQTSITRFLTTLTSYPALLSVDLYCYFNRLFKPDDALPLQYYKLLSSIIPKLSQAQFIELLESTLLSHLDGRWSEINASGMKLCYFELYLAVLRFGRDLPIFSLLLDKFALTGFESNFVEAVRSCQCRELYGVLRQLYM